MTDNFISDQLRQHYSDMYERYGPTCRGVDWGADPEKAVLRHMTMLDLLIDTRQSFSILDAGCGYGAFNSLLSQEGYSCEYTGVDLVEGMVAEAQDRHPDSTFLHGDILELNIPKHDYVVCNGILTQKLKVSTLHMNRYAQLLIRRLYSLCRIGVAFNVMSTYVNHQNELLYYRNPSELMSWCMSEITPRLKINHSYGIWYEYTMYLYRGHAMEQ